ncbi:MAG: hypothetical protein SGBAC_013493 [Bacillariaceae sp.]
MAESSRHRVRRLAREEAEAREAVAANNDEEEHSNDETAAAAIDDEEEQEPREEEVIDEEEAADEEDIDYIIGTEEQHINDDWGIHQKKTKNDAARMTALTLRHLNSERGLRYKYKSHTAIYFDTGTV